MAASTSVDLANPITSFNPITASPGNDRQVGLQLSFDVLSKTLYGTNYRDGNWDTIDTTSGALTQIAGFNTFVAGGVGFRDLGGAAANPGPQVSAISEPLSVLGLGFFIAGTLLVRRRV